MNFSIAQWVLSFVLDFILKAVLLGLIGARASFSVVPLPLLASLALSFSTFHFFVCCWPAALLPFSG